MVRRPEYFFWKTRQSSCHFATENTKIIQVALRTRIQTHMAEIDVLWLYNLPLHEYTMPVIHCARSPVSIPTALVVEGDLSEQLEQIRAFVLDYLEQSCFSKGIVLYDDNGDAAGLQP